MKYLLSPQEYTLPNPRIDGWKKLQEVKARIVDIFIFPLEIFQYYFEHKDLPKEFTGGPMSCLAWKIHPARDF